MRIGLIDVDGHNFPNFALMRISAFYKDKGWNVDWANIFEKYNKVYASKVFTFSEDYNYLGLHADLIEKGGTGYDIQKCLTEEIEESTKMDYSLYPMFDFSVQFFSRGCIRNCPFCLVREKEGYINSVSPVDLNPKGKHIEVLDNNFFANPNWKEAIMMLIKWNQPVKLHGVDIRIMNEEQAFWLNKLKLKGQIHVAWDIPTIDLTDKLKDAVKYIKKNKIMCYVLIGYNSTREQDMYRLNTLRSIGIDPFVMCYRDYNKNNIPTQYEKDLARWANNKIIYRSTSFEDYSPRRGFKCNKYF